MGNSRRTIKQHTVPRFLLERFADERRQVQRVALPGAVRHRESINSATVVNDFYTVELGDGSLSDSAEQMFSAIEGDAAQALRAVIDQREWPATDEHRAAIATFAALQALRTLNVRQSHDDILNTIVRLQIGADGKDALRRRMVEEFGGAPTPQDVDRMWDHFTRAGGPGFKTHPNVHVKAIVDLLPGTARMFYDRGWALHRFQRRAIATTDNPVALVGHPGEEHMGVGVGTAKYVILPLSRRDVLVMNWIGVDDTPAVVPGSTAAARELNQVIVAHAVRAIYHHPDDDPLVGIRLPDPARHQMDAGDLAGLIREEGLFAQQFAAADTQPGPTTG